MSVERLSEAEIRQALQSLPEWEYDGKAIARAQSFASFLRGIGFVNALAHLAERMDHHPDMEIRYREITVRYWTHTAGGVTSLDLAAAREAGQLMAQFRKEPLYVSGSD